MNHRPAMISNRGRCDYRRYRINSVGAFLRRNFLVFGFYAFLSMGNLRGTRRLRTARGILFRKVFVHMSRLTENASALVILLRVCF